MPCRTIIRLRFYPVAQSNERVRRTDVEMNETYMYIMYIIQLIN